MDFIVSELKERRSRTVGKTEWFNACVYMYSSCMVSFPVFISALLASAEYASSHSVLYNLNITKSESAHTLHIS